MDFPAGGAGHLAQQFHPLGEVIAGQIGLGKIARHLLEGKDRALPQDDEDATAFSQPFVRHGDDGGVLHAGVAVEQFFHFHHRNVLPAPDDDVLGAPGDADVPLGVQAGLVPGFEPALPVHGVVLGVFEIAHEIGRSPRLQAAFLARGQGGAMVFVHHPQLHAFERRAVGFEHLAGRVSQAGGGDQAVLGHAPP